jgi:DNA-binding beta-propeller fold protein YncE
MRNEQIDSEMPLQEEYVETYVEVVDNRRRVAVLTLVLLILLLMLGALSWYLYGATRPAGTPTAGSLSKGMTWVRSIYGWGPQEAERLVAPTDVAIAPDGSYWTVSKHQMLVGFDQNGRLAGSIQLPRGDKPGQIESIEGLEIDDDGNMYVVDYGNAKVLKIDLKGKVDGEVLVSYPQAAAVNDKYLAIASVPGVAMFSRATGDLAGKWGGKGSDLEQFDNARGIAFGRDGTVFVSDAHNKRVKAYTAQGRILWSVPDTATVTAARAMDMLTPEKRKALGQKMPFELPAGITVDSAGRVVLVDAFKFRIVALDARTGKVLGTWGRDGSDEGMFAYPTGIAYDAKRDYYVVADTANNRLQVLTIEGSGGSPASMARRLLSKPVWICALPLVFLLGLVLLALLQRRRRRRALDPDSGSGAPNAGGDTAQ